MDLPSGQNQSTNTDIRKDETLPSSMNIMTGETLTVKPCSDTVSFLVLDRETLSRALGERFTLEREIGKGGMGVVYLARDNQLKRPVAVKTIISDKNSPKESVERFRFEAVIAASLRHPNIIQVYETIEFQNQPVYIMEYIEGVTLKDYASQKKPLHEIVSLMIPICKALGYAHTQGILHRDLKPSNIMLTGSGDPKIMDFGLAKQLNPVPFADCTPSHTVDGVIIGSPHYMSPEQARGDISHMDNRSDIFSLGATLYQLLTGYPPFHDSFSADLIYRILHKDPVLPSQIRKDCSKDLEAICMKAMEKEPSQRYQTGHEMASDLELHHHGYPVQARHYTFREKAVRAVKRNKETFFLSSLGIWLMFFCILFSLIHYHDISKATSIRELRSKLTGIANTASLLINGDLVETVSRTQDINREEVRHLIHLLKEIKNRNENIDYVYLMRLSQKKKGYAEFIVIDNLLDSFEERDKNHNGVLDPDENSVNIGDIFNETPKFPELIAGFHHATSDQDIRIEDQWGVCLSGYAPIRNSKEKVVGLIGLDMKNNQVARYLRQINVTFFRTVVVFVFLCLFFHLLLVVWIISIWQGKRIKN
ncbi:MAG: serine/threonine protein kinase [Candidatus Aureabacteria bacterium]|nr:serine/threonine protein kinase [Candidatus Auribacterota bacterium]